MLAKSGRNVSALRTGGLDQSVHQRLSLSEARKSQQSPSFHGRSSLQSDPRNSTSRKSKEGVMGVKERWLALRGLKEVEHGDGSGSGSSSRFGSSALSRSVRNMMSSNVGVFFDEALKADLGWDDDGGEEGILATCLAHSWVFSAQRARHSTFLHSPLGFSFSSSCPSLLCPLPPPRPPSPPPPCFWWFVRVILFYTS
jgi:hypothetical protein